MAAALGFFGTNGPMRSRMGFSGWKTCWDRPIRCCCFDRYQVSEDWTYFKRMRGEWNETMSNFQIFLFWFARYLVIFSLTRDPIDTLESSAYIDLISVACACVHRLSTWSSVDFIVKPFRLTHILTVQVYIVYICTLFVYGILCVVAADIYSTRKRFSNAGGIYYITEQNRWHDMKSSIFTTVLASFQLDLSSFTQDVSSHFFTSENTRASREISTACFRKMEKGQLGWHPLM